MLNFFDFPLQPFQKFRRRDTVQLGVVKLKGQRQGGAQPLFPVLAPDEEGVVVAPGVDIHGAVDLIPRQGGGADHHVVLAQLDCDGYAIGGLAVGEPAEVMYEIIDAVEPHMPKEKPRYLMGVGTPSNIIEAVSRGVDFFDCVMPSRNGRHGKLFTWEGTVNILNEKYAEDPRPVSESCGCPLCRNYSRAYIRHLFKADEVLALRLAVLHNLYFYNDLLAKIRQALDEDRFDAFRAKYSGVLEQRV